MTWIIDFLAWTGFIVWGVILYVAWHGVVRPFLFPTPYERKHDKLYEAKRYIEAKDAK